jgi:hypothetical protein
MKILFVAEVFPMRNSFTEHSLVSREFLTNVSSLLHNQNSDISDARILCNNQTMDLLFQDYIRLVPSVIRLSDKTSKLSEETLLDWNLGGLEAWKEYVLGNGDFAKCLFAELLELHRTTFDFDMLVCWGENGVFDSICRELDIPCLHLELASTRKPFFEGRMVDCLGANGSASFKTIDFVELEASLRPPNVDFWSAYYNIAGEGHTENVGFDDSSLTYWEEDNTLDIFKDSKQKTALIGLQLFDDANTQRHSEFSSPLNFLESVIPKLTKKGWNIVVKTHPGAIHRPINYIEQNKALRYAKSYSNCYVYEQANDERNYLSLLRNVDLVVVINSSMGFESSLLGKVVVILGDALYKIPCVYPTLQEAFSKEFDKEEYLRKLSYVTYFFSKYVFIDRKMLLKDKYYLAVNEYWTENKELLLDSKFSVESFIKYFDEFSSCFVNQRPVKTDDSLENYKYLLPNYLISSPKRDDVTQVINDHLTFKRSQTKVKLVEGKVNFCIDSFVVSQASFYLEGWAFDHKTKVPPVMLMILFQGVVLHVGRISAKRKDVQEVFALTHDSFGYKFNINFNGSVNTPKVLFVFSDGEAELIDVEYQNTSSSSVILL